MPEIAKLYPPVGPFQMTRYKEFVEFICTACERKKKSTLVATEDGKDQICNGCYGQVLHERGLT